MNLDRAGRAAMVTALLCALGGCTSADGYELVRAAGEAKAECDREPTVAAQRACEEAYQQSYDSYRSERNAVLDEEADTAPR